MMATPRVAAELETLGCSREVALKLSSNYNNDRFESLRAYARMLFRTPQQRRKSTSFFMHPIHHKEIDCLMEIGFSEEDSERQLKLANYDIASALKMLITMFQNGSLDVTELIPIVREREIHNQLMLSHLKREEHAQWNATAIRALGKFKLAAKSVKEYNPYRLSDQERRKSIANKELLDQRLKNLEMAELVMTGDGNCQFRSVSYELFGTQSFHFFVRRKATAYLREHPETFAILFENTSAFEKYVTEMEKPTVWGDELTLKAISESLNVSIHVLTSNKGFGGHYLEYNPDRKGEVMDGFVFMTYLSPIHYNVMTLKDDPARRRKSGRAMQWFLSSVE